jgi:hypothetical protein
LSAPAEAVPADGTVLGTNTPSCGLGWGVSAPPLPGAVRTVGPAPVSVRPHPVAVAEQRARRTALVLALDGVDIGPWVIHGHRVGVPVGTRAEVTV